LRWLITFHVIVLSWLFFRADSLSTIGEMLHRVWVGGGTTTLSWLVVLIVVAGFVPQFLPRTPMLRGRDLFARLGAVPQGLVLATVLALITFTVNGQGVAPFIYYQF
jgi:hypothetical protein